MARSRTLLFAAAAALLAAFAVQAQTTERIRGTITGFEGNTLSVKSREGKDVRIDGSQKILVPPGTPIVTTTPADRSFLKAGEYVFMSANVGPDGKMTTSARIQVSKDGVKPPQ